MKRTLLFGFLAALALGGAVFTNRPIDTPLASASLGLINVVVDADRPPAIVNVLLGGTITIVKQGGGTQNISVIAIPTDGRGFLFLQLPGGQSGTKIRPTRRGTGIIQIRQPASRGGRSFSTITVFVH